MISIRQKWIKYFSAVCTAVSVFGILSSSFAQSPAQKVEFPNGAQAGTATYSATLQQTGVYKGQPYGIITYEVFAKKGQTLLASFRSLDPSQPLNIGNVFVSIHDANGKELAVNNDNLWKANLEIPQEGNYKIWVRGDPEVKYKLEIQLSSSSSPQNNSYITPPKGSTDRKEIMDAIRTYMKDANIEMIFVVKFLRVHSGWAWANVNPQSPDGKSHYEPIAVLLAKKDGAWKVVMGDCSQDPEATNPCPATRKEFNEQLKKKFPEMPIDILPTD